jgi:GAF domain-containing protein
LEGVALKRDLLYVGLGIGSLTALYLLIAKVLHSGGHIFSNLTLIMIVIVAVSSLMAYDALRNSLDRLFYREHYRQLRAELRALSRETGIRHGLPERLQAVLSALCTTLHVKGGLIALREGETFVCQATERAPPSGEVFSLEDLAATEITSLPQPSAAGPQGMTLLVPIRTDGEQVAALALGGTEDEAPFGEEDLFLLDDLAERLGAMIRATRLQEENTRLLSQMVSDFRQQEHALQRQAHSLVSASLEESQPPLGGKDNEEFVSSVEDALRRLYDYSYLGEHELSQLLVVQKRLEGQEPGSVTHIDCGKALSEFLVQGIQKLRPEGPEPKPLTVPSREWHQFLILHSAYVSGKPTRDIMGRLYIGEGTFNRTRRRALQGLAKAVQEMEQGVSRAG